MASNGMEVERMVVDDEPMRGILVYKREERWEWRELEGSCTYVIVEEVALPTMVMVIYGEDVMEVSNSVEVE